MELPGHLIEGFPPSLRARVLTLIARLVKVSEARAGSLERNHSGKSEDAPPPGTLQDPRSRRPDPDVWLLDWYLWKLERAQELEGAAREMLAIAATIEAEIRLSKRTHRAPADFTAGTLNSGAAVNSEDRDTRILTEYEGLSPFEVSVIELHRAGWCPPSNVERLRRRDDRDPRSGHALPTDARLKGEERIERAQELREKGLSLRAIAKRLNVAHPTVKRWLEK